MIPQPPHNADAAPPGLLGHPAFRSLESELTTVRLKGGETLFLAGEPGDALYVVVFGRLRALLTGGPWGDRVLGEIGRGESVGEMALLTGEPRSATVVAVRDTELVKLSSDAFQRLVQRDPNVMLDLVRLIIARYQRVIRPSERYQSVAVALALVPCTADVPIKNFSGDLVRALSRTRKVFAMDADGVERHRGVRADESGFESPELAGWLQEQELRHEYAVYTADPRPSAWTRMCVRQADLVLLVGAAGGVAQMDRGLLHLVRADETRRELALLYDPVRQAPQHAAEWLSLLPFTAHHHVDPAQSRDYERLARMLTGHAIGLVLGGGGARGLAHIGVIQALEEARIPVDLVGGTSIGAVIGGQLASGWTSARILAETRKMLVEGGSLNDYTVPVIALLRGRRFFGMLRKLYGDRRIEDLPIGYFCISTNLSQSTCMVHRSGLLQKWVAASMAVPGMGPPIFDGRDVLVDGGVVNNLPVDIMRGFARGPVFASNVSPRVEMRLDREYPDFPSPWRVLFSWVNPWGTPMQVPGIASILTRTVSLRQRTAEAVEQDDADLLFEPPSGGHRFLDWHAFDRIVDASYHSAMATLERWSRQGNPPSLPGTGAQDV